MTPANRYLAGNFAPVRHEETLFDLEVTGRIPDFLDGRYVRNGPNPIGTVDPASYHWFLGDGMVHGVRLRDGRAEWYRNRWVRSPGAAAALGSPAPPHRSTTGAPGLGANTHVIAHAGHTLALVEAGISCYRLGAELETLGGHDFGGPQPGGFTAHPKLDPATGKLHAVSHHFGFPGTVRYSVLDPAGRVRHSADVEVGGSPLMHDFALTLRHVVLLDLPVTFDARKAVAATVPAPLRRPAGAVLAAVAGRVRVPDSVMWALIRRDTPRTRRSRNHDLPYSWDPGRPARIGVLPRRGGSTGVRWFGIDPCFVFHTLGAYDEEDVVVLDAVQHAEVFVNDPHGPGGGRPRLCRWRLDLRTGRAAMTVLDDREQEFPRIDERRVGGRHRYGYSVAVESDSGVFGGAVIRHDLRAGTSVRRSLGKHVEGGEVVFVPRGADAAEDDGVLMGFAYERDTGFSKLVILDAASLATVAEIRLPVRVPHGNHGNWLPTTADLRTEAV